MRCVLCDSVGEDRPFASAEARPRRRVTNKANLGGREARDWRIGDSKQRRRGMWEHEMSNKANLPPAGRHHRGPETTTGQGRRCMCENIPAWMCHPNPRRGRPPCLPSSLKAIRCWAWRVRATTGSCPYGRVRLCVAQMGIARISAQTLADAETECGFALGAVVVKWTVG